MWSVRIQDADIIAVKVVKILLRVGNIGMDISGIIVNIVGPILWRQKGHHCIGSV